MTSSAFEVSCVLGDNCMFMIRHAQDVAECWEDEDVDSLICRLKLPDSESTVSGNNHREFLLNTHDNALLESVQIGQKNSSGEMVGIDSASEGVSNVVRLDYVDRGYGGLPTNKETMQTRKPRATFVKGIPQEIRINILIQQCRNLAQVLELCEQRGSDFNFVNISCAMHIIARFFDRESLPQVQGIWWRMEAMALDMKEPWLPRNIAIITWSLSKLPTATSARFWASILEKSCQVSNEFRPMDLAQTLHGLAVLRVDLSLEFITAMSIRLESVLEDMNCQDLANLLWSVATQMSRPGGGKHPSSDSAGNELLAVRKAQLDLARRATGRAAACLHRFPPVEFGGLMWALGKLKLYPGEEFIRASLRRAAEVSGFSQPHGLTSILWGMANLAEVGECPLDPELCSAAANCALRTAEQFEPVSIANFFWAFARARICPEAAVIESLSQRAVATAGRFLPQELASLLWSLATLDISPGRRLISSVKARALTTVGEFNPRDVSNLLWASERLGLDLGPELTARLSERILEISDKFCPTSLAITIRSLTKLDERPSEELAAAVCRRAEQTAGDFIAQDISNLFWSFATLRIRPCPGAAGALLRRAACIAADFIPQNIGNLMWSLAVLRIQPAPGLVSSLSSTAVLRSDGFNSQNISNLLWALATMEFRPGGGLVAFMLRRAADISHKFTPQEIANLLWALARMGAALGEEIVDLMCARFLDVVASAVPQNFSNLLWALSVLGADPGAEFVAGLMDRVVEVIHDLDAGEVSSLLWACASLDCPPRPEQLPELCRQLVRLLRQREASCQIENAVIALWSSAVLGFEPGREAVGALSDFLEARCLQLTGEHELLSMLHQVNLCRRHLGFLSGLSVPVLDRADLRGLCERAFRASPPTRSAFQAEVCSALTSIGAVFTEVMPAPRLLSRVIPEAVAMLWDTISGQ